jgi:uncharacterized protein (DUF433 family)
MANGPRYYKARDNEGNEPGVLGFMGGADFDATSFRPLSREKSVSALKSFPRITRTPGVMGGKPCIKGSRMTVGMIVAQIAGGATIEELMDDFPLLKRADILQAIGYAGWLASDMLLDLHPAA